ncbi:RM38 protein, partial [Ciccaba nigrolineata]|nr:RM38 protein [Ciccaba nigrolineata]
EPKTDISLPHKLLQAKEIKERKKILRENHQNAEVEGAAWLQTVLIPLEEARAEWEKTSGPFHKQRVAEHCGIFRALFKGATFTPWVTQRLECSQEDKHPVLVCCGNMVTVSEVPPAVSYEADKGFLWTWLLTNPGKRMDIERSKVFVFRTNSPGNAIESGKEICCYSPPFPAVGTGCHCFIFLLLQPDCPVDFSKGVWQTPCHSLKMGTFSTFDFSRKREAAVTPAGLACFQCQWGSSIT